MTKLDIGQALVNLKLRYRYLGGTYLKLSKHPFLIGVPLLTDFGIHKIWIGKLCG